MRTVTPCTPQESSPRPKPLPSFPRLPPAIPLHGNLHRPNVLLRQPTKPCTRHPCVLGMGTCVVGEQYGQPSSQIVAEDVGWIQKLLSVGVACSSSGKSVGSSMPRHCHLCTGGSNCPEAPVVIRLESMGAWAGVNVDGGRVNHAYAVEKLIVMGPSRRSKPNGGVKASQKGDWCNTGHRDRRGKFSDGRLSVPGYSTEPSWGSRALAVAFSYWGVVSSQAVTESWSVVMWTISVKDGSIFLGWL